MKVTRSCLTLCDPMDCIVRGILQARILEWVAFPPSRGSSQSSDRTQVFCIAGRFFTSWATKDELKITQNRNGIFLLGCVGLWDMSHRGPFEESLVTSWTYQSNTKGYRSGFIKKKPCRFHEFDRKYCRVQPCLSRSAQFLPLPVLFPRGGFFSSITKKDLSSFSWCDIPTLQFSHQKFPHKISFLINFNIIEISSSKH